MKIISLNIWCGQIFEPLLTFIKQNEEVDVFCFQEVMSTKTETKWSNKCRMNIFEEIEKTLPEHQGYFAMSQDKVDIEGQVDFDSSFGLAMFIKKEVIINKVDNIFVFRHQNACIFSNSEEHGAVTMGRNMQCAELKTKDRVYTVCNLHGLWNGQGKGDSENRLEQAHKVKNYLDAAKGYKILCGDFNLRPDTESLKIMKDGLVNLIEINKIKSTRTPYYRHYQEPGESFADYLLISPEIKVNKFMVMPDEVSDHSPLLVDLE